MARLQRRTTILCTALVALSLAAGAFGLAWHAGTGMALLGRALPISAQSAIEVGYVWGLVYLASLAAGVVLIGFAARGTRVRVSFALVIAAVLSPLAAFLVVDIAGY
jgi:hypothetical protein